MSDQDKIKDHATTIIGFGGLLLGLLVNALTAIKFEEFNTTQFSDIPYTGTYLSQFPIMLLKFLFLAATSCFLISIINGLSVHSEIIDPKKTNANQIINDPAKILKISVKWLCSGLAIVSFIIALMVTKSITCTLAYVTITIIIMFYDYYKMHKKQSSLLPIKTEERNN